VLDEGRLTDGQGRTVDFKNTVLVMTSNLGSHMIQQMALNEADYDYGVLKLAVMAEVKTHFRPEFINRIDEVVVFHGLGEEHIRSIAKIQLGVLKARLAKMDYGFDISDGAVAQLAKVGFDPVYGARPLKRAIQSEIENPLAKAILEGRFAPKDTIRADYRGGKIVFEKSPAKAAA
jgi:ATP-dependent Clp protease ATP-binding subunit ClpB